MNGLAWTAYKLANCLEKHDLLYLCDDEQSAQNLAAALSAMALEHPVIHLPSSDALPGEKAAASPANIGHRIAALRRLRRLSLARDRRTCALIMSGEAAARRYPAPVQFDGAPPRLAVGEEIDIARIGEDLLEIGYVTDERVDEAGEVAVRGDVVDIFPADAGMPVRVELAAGRIAAIRAYDPVSQRSCDTLEEIEIGRMYEPAPEGNVTILDHFGTAHIGMATDADRRRRRFVRLAMDAAKRGDDDLDAVSNEVWEAALAMRERLTLDEAGCASVPRFAEAKVPLAGFTAYARKLLKEKRTLLLVGAVRDLRFLAPRIAKRLDRQFEPAADLAQVMALAPGSIAMLTAPILAGFESDALVVVAAGDLLGSRALKDAGALAAARPAFDFSVDIRVGDVVVHEDHGVAIVSGFEDAPGVDGEMIALEFAGETRRLVPVGQADRLWRYGADAEAVTLDKLDGKSWERRRADIDLALAESARGLAALADARAAREASIIEPDAAAYEAFVSGFPFNETADQARAITQVRDDLARGRPMDRLVVGDVGYGKTEVALRAAALAALAGYQVIVAAPTTVLVRQHIETFGRRFADTGLRVAGLSRLSSAPDKKAVKAGLADGSIRVVVGTGAVMAKDVSFQKLGLVIIDEEQRFGAADKAHLRGDVSVHILSLSATPIPRTLQSALVGLREISIIATPPARRQPIRTSIDTFDDGRVRTALLREQGRGGQSFVVVPRIEDMGKIGDRIRRLVPELTIVEAHGKMQAAAIDEVMVGFGDGKGDVLLATNIIEAGLDVPRANTMIVWRADRFGLAQLHQLRGRVGRGNRRGQVLLLTDGDIKIAERTLKRLRTLTAFDRLGAGFEISARDLDMRGAGDLLGETQAGHIKLIGTDLYQHMMGLALRRARGEAVERWSPDLHIGSLGHLPDAWIPETDLRLSLYVRLARAETEDDLDALEEEMTDRFGPLPAAAETLLARYRIGIMARRASIARIDAGPAAIALTPRANFAGDADQAGLQAKDGRLLLAEPSADADRSDRVLSLLETLSA